MSLGDGNFAFPFFPDRRLLVPSLRLAVHIIYKKL